MQTPSEYTPRRSQRWPALDWHDNAAGWRIVILLALLLSVAACNRTPPEGITDISCETLTANGLADMMLETTTQPKLARRIAATFDVTPSGEYWQQTIDGDVQHLFYYQWDVAQTGYVALIRNDALTYLNMGFSNRSAQPALGRVIECLGSPDHYFILYSQWPDAGGPQFFTDYYYTDKGIHLRVEVPAPRLTTNDDLVLLEHPITAATPVDSIQWVEPGNIRELDWHATLPFGPYADSFGETVDKEEWWESRSDLYDHVQPWPGSIEQLQVTWIEPYMLPPTPTPPPPPPITPE